MFELNVFICVVSFILVWLFVVFAVRNSTPGNLERSSQKIFDRTEFLYLLSPFGSGLRPQKNDAASEVTGRRVSNVYLY